ncbi:tetratricopeptide repeat protein [Sphingosinicella sp. LHD-64]|uniref:tetratricopeptide repeat protein n=1 Tax=Sphingosinicella sp. LHD-64 TaxID=3072139 RepID=UPI002810641E|nr:tetratricopeptide repeat protein [Sphingosinicella sp. LHD-64]MDQ8756880.1 tetratricopeptide repeat protein [Sphingosinicella sp. LHD-64]
MRGWIRFALGLAAFAAGNSAVAQDSVAGTAGTYIVERMETASALELGEDGRFRWGFSYGALDMIAEGRWRRDGDAVVLDTEPAVTPPRFEMIATEAGRGPLTVRIEDANGTRAHYLDVVAEYEGGEGDFGFQDGDAFAFEPSERRIVAVRLGSQAFGFLSEPFPVPEGTRRMRFRFLPGDLGRGDFRGTRATIEGDALLLPVLGEPLRYRRLSAEELAASQGVVDDIAAEAGRLATENSDWATCLGDAGQYSPAQAMAGCTALIDGDALAADEKSAPHFYRGNLRFDSGDYQGAIADFSAVLVAYPDYAGAYDGLADSHRQLGDYARAAAESRTAARLAPEDPDILNGLCWHLALAGEELDRAREACDRGLALRPDDPDTLDSRGFVGLVQRRFNDAWTDFDAAVRLGDGHENQASFLYGRGVAALRLGRTADGQADLARAAAIDAEIAAAYARYGVQP